VLPVLSSAAVTRQGVGAIGDFTPEVPKVGWESQFDLDRGGAVVRFRLREIGWEFDPTSAGRVVDAALQHVAEEHRYTIENP
jgi:hypothetical protein